MRKFSQMILQLSLKAFKNLGYNLPVFYYCRHLFQTPNFVVR